MAMASEGHSHRHHALMHHVDLNKCRDYGELIGDAIFAGEKWGTFVYCRIDMLDYPNEGLIFGRLKNKIIDISKNSSMNDDLRIHIFPVYSRFIIVLKYIIFSAYL